MIVFEWCWVVGDGYLLLGEWLYILGLDIGFFVEVVIDMFGFIVDYVVFDVVFMLVVVYVDMFFFVVCVMCMK